MLVDTKEYLEYQQKRLYTLAESLDIIYTRMSEEVKRHSSLGFFHRLLDKGFNDNYEYEAKNRRRDIYETNKLIRRLSYAIRQGDGLYSISKLDADIYLMDLDSK